MGMKDEILEILRQHLLNEDLGQGECSVDPTRHSLENLPCVRCGAVL